MALSHAISVRNTLADSVDSAVNSGSIDDQGDFVIIDSAGPTDLVVFNLQDPAFDAASSGTINLQGTTLSTTASSGGTADKFEVRDKDNNLVFDGTATATGGGGDIELTNTNIKSGQTVEITSFSYTASA